ncbi:hypothetical protein VPHK375_0089 [Vibrio phage K375]
MKEVKSLIISAPNHATGYRLSDGFYVEWFSGSKSEGWSLISSSHHDIRSVDTSKPVIEIEKPRTKTEFVKCEFNHAWEAVKAFEDGEELYTKRSHKDFVLIDNAPDVLRFLYDLHRKVEIEIDERQEFIDFTSKYIKNLNPETLKSFEYIARAMYDSGKFKLVEK